MDPVIAMDSEIRIGALKKTAKPFLDKMKPPKVKGKASVAVAADVPAAALPVEILIEMLEAFQATIKTIFPNPVAAYFASWGISLVVKMLKNLA